jgi:hypothetical protein
VLLLGPMPLTFADASFEAPIAVLPRTLGCGKGLLRHRTLVWGWSSLWAACQPAPVQGEK